MRKRVLLIATGGTIASKHTQEGLTPQLTGNELLSCVPEADKICLVDSMQAFNLDSTNVRCEQWLILAGLIREHYDA